MLITKINLIGKFQMRRISDNSTAIIQHFFNNYIYCKKKSIDMIQRIQSIYLLLTSFFYFIYWFFGHKWYEKGYVFFKQEILNTFDMKFHNLLFDITTFCPLVVSLTCLISIFCFHKRLIQIKLTKFSFFLSLFMLIYSVLYFYFTLYYLIDMIDLMIVELFLYAAIINPFICTWLLYFAIKKIQYDHDLINSINRLR